MALETKQRRFGAFGLVNQLLPFGFDWWTGFIIDALRDTSPFSSASINRRVTFFVRNFVTLENEREATKKQPHQRKRNSSFWTNLLLFTASRSGLDDKNAVHTLGHVQSGSPGSDSRCWWSTLGVGVLLVQFCCYVKRILMYICTCFLYLRAKLGESGVAVSMLWRLII